MGDPSFMLAVRWRDFALSLAESAHAEATVFRTQAQSTFLWEWRKRRRLLALAQSWLDCSIGHAEIAAWWALVATDSCVAMTKRSMALMFDEVAALGALEEFSDLLSEIAAWETSHEQA